MPLKILFIINPGSGAGKTDWAELITKQCNGNSCSFRLYDLPDKCKPEQLTATIREYAPARVVAVGGDGTVNIIAKSLLPLDIPLGILPAGSANGMAKELGIPADPEEAIAICLNGIPKKIHVVEINDELCIHLSDIGFNAYVTKKFKALKRRGLLSYIRAGWKIFWNQQSMRVKIISGNKEITRKAIMVVIANASKWGTGVVINPDGKLDDDLFEVIIIPKRSFLQSVKMLLTKRANAPGETELIQTRSITLKPYRPSHFQVDGEYLGRVSEVKAGIIPGALSLIFPPGETIKK